MELRSSIIRHPSSAPFILRRIYWVEINEMEGDDPRSSLAEVCAELLGVFEYHANNNFANRILNALIINAKRKTRKALKDTKEWLPYSVSYLQEMLFYSRGKVQIEKAIKRLIEKGFLLSNCPKDIQEFYSQNVSWYKLNVEALNALADAVEAGQTYDPEKPEPAKKAAKRRTLDTIAKEIADFHKHITNIHNYSYDRKRLRLIRNRYVERKAYWTGQQVDNPDDRAFNECILAIIVNSQDDFYQGRHETQKKVLNQVERIFKENRIVELHCVTKANEQGITEEMALSEYEVFISGGTSRYSKLYGKTAQKANTEPQVVSYAKFDGDLAPYRNFARKIVTFFTDGKRANEVLETLLLDDELDSFGNKLADAETLANQITAAAKMFVETPGQKLLTEINQFAVEYTANNIANLED